MSTYLVSGRSRYPYVYWIRKHVYIYIGETQRHPVIRWGSHLGNNGSFSQNLRDRDMEAWRQDSDVRFFVVPCEQVANESKPEEHKLITRYIEHKLHELLVANLGRFRSIESVISDTSKTAPRAPRHHEWVDQYVESIFSIMVDDLSFFDRQ